MMVVWWVGGFSDFSCQKSNKKVPITAIFTSVLVVK